MSATIPAASTVTFVTAGPVRAHVISVIAHGVSVEKLAALTGVDRALIRSLTAHGRNRTTIVSDVADRLFLVRPDLSDAAPTDRVIAAGATRRLRGLVATGWTVQQVAGLLGAAPEWVEVLLTGRTSTLTVRAHRRVAEMFRQHWMHEPPSRDADSIARAQQEGWVSGLAWDDIDFDMAPIKHATKRKRKADDGLVDEMAVQMACRGEQVPLSVAERRLVIRELHGRGLADNTISVISGIPLTTVWNLRTDMGLPVNTGESTLANAA